RPPGPHRPSPPADHHHGDVMPVHQGLFQVPWSQYAADLVDGLFKTLEYAAAGFAGAVLLGLLLAMMRLSERWFVRLPARLYTEVFKNIPLLAIIFVTYFGLASVGIRLDTFTAGTL